ncbi:MULTISPECIES: pyrimidine/purine nucleoside phosphorylase [unclassified Acinetobacter]|uniref:pyrimidine/purine nucleoside phosphorylase n=1 Tax=unclassified Acinetobacter TaxID=196816 RepID=UPI0035A013B8
MLNQFDFVSIVKKPTVHYGGRWVSHVLKIEDGSQKTIGVFLISEQPMTFEVHVKERVEITSG